LFYLSRNNSWNDITGNLAEFINIPSFHNAICLAQATARIYHKSTTTTSLEYTNIMTKTYKRDKQIALDIVKPFVTLKQFDNLSKLTEYKTTESMEESTKYLINHQSSLVNTKFLQTAATFIENLANFQKNPTNLLLFKTLLETYIPLISGITDKEHLQIQRAVNLLKCLIDFGINLSPHFNYVT